MLLLEQEGLNSLLLFSEIFLLELKHINILHVEVEAVFIGY